MRRRLSARPTRTRRRNRAHSRRSRSMDRASARVAVAPWRKKARHPCAPRLPRPTPSPPRAVSTTARCPGCSSAGESPRSFETAFLACIRQRGMMPSASSPAGAAQVEYSLQALRYPRDTAPNTPRYGIIGSLRPTEACGRRGLWFAARYREKLRPSGLGVLWKSGSAGNWAMTRTKEVRSHDVGVSNRFLPAEDSHRISRADDLRVTVLTGYRQARSGVLEGMFSANSSAPLGLDALALISS